MLGWTLSQLNLKGGQVTPQEEALELQANIRAAVEHMKMLHTRRREVLLALHKSGMTPRQIAKLLGINHSPVYKILEKAGYEPDYSFKAAHMRREAQREIVAKMKTQGRQHV